MLLCNVFGFVDQRVRTLTEQRGVALWSHAIPRRLRAASRAVHTPRVTSTKYARLANLQGDS